MASNWPLTAADLRAALQYTIGQESDPELAEFMNAACELIDRMTGRDREPTRHEVGGKVPYIFVLGAKATAKLWWQQERNGPRTRPAQGDVAAGPPMGASLPRKVEAWLADYPPRLYIPDVTP